MRSTTPNTAVATASSWRPPPERRMSTKVPDTAADGADMAAEPNAQQRQLTDALRELQMAQAELTQAHKLSAIGQLAAGVAHEINTPIQYVGDNVAFLERVFAHLLPVVEAATQL